jgi:hypothetical protein
MSDFKEKAIEILLYPIAAVVFLLFLLYALYVRCRCKITGEKYCVNKIGPNGFYRLKDGIRYYSKGEKRKD